MEIRTERTLCWPQAEAAPLGAVPTAGIVALYEVATLATMAGLVAAARAGVRRVRLPWLDLYGDTAAGAVIAAVGIAVLGLGW
jgi:hypothetical protein